MPTLADHKAAFLCAGLALLVPGCDLDTDSLIAPLKVDAGADAGDQDDAGVVTSPPSTVPLEVRGQIMP